MLDLFCRTTVPPLLLAPFLLERHDLLVACFGLLCLFWLMGGGARNA